MDANCGGHGHRGSTKGVLDRGGFKLACNNPDGQKPRDSRKGRGHRKKDPGGCGGSSDDRSSDSEPEDDDAQTRHDREIDIKRIDDFTITCKSIRKARKCKKRINMRCEDEKFSRGTDVNIKESIVQMEFYLETRTSDRRPTCDLSLLRFSTHTSRKQ